MKRLGLIGKDISHSRSPEIYKKILAVEHSYELIDIASEKNLPSIEELKTKFDGLNITSPYKKVYYQDVEFESEEIQRLGSINCLKFTANNVLADNTDYRALLVLLPKYFTNFNAKKVVILGSGVMSWLVQQVCEKYQISFEIKSRKTDGDLNQLHYSDHSLIVNACSRDFCFHSILNDTNSFWDLNYAHQFHAKHFSNHKIVYQDGLELLELQATMAVKFWNF